MILNRRRADLLGVHSRSGPNQNAKVTLTDEFMKLSQFLLDAGERPFRELVRHHLERQSATQMQQAVMGEASALPKELQPMVESYIDELNEQLLPRREFWQKSTCRDAVNVVLNLRNEHLGLSFELPVDVAKMSGVEQELALELFQIATLSFAYSAVDQPAARKFMGIPAKRRWFFPVLFTAFICGLFGDFVRAWGEWLVDVIYR